MKPISNEIMDYLKTNFGSQIKNIHSDIIKNEGLTKQFFENLLKDLKEAKRISKQTKVTTKTLTETPEIEISEYITQSLVDSIQTTYQFRFTVNRQNVTVNMCILKNNKMPLYRIYNSIYKILLWLLVANNYRKQQCSQELDIFLIMSKDTKKLPNKKNNGGTTNEIINKEHVNGAYTYSCRTQNKIMIFREEEWFKVFVHETIHAFGLDFSNDTELISYTETEIKNTFNVSSTINFFETYCEINAVLVNILFYVFLLPDESNDTAVIKKCLHFLSFEKMFSLLQCSKVLNHYQLKYQDLIRSNDEETKQTDSHSVYAYDTHTNVFSYYILKSILLFGSGNYMNWWFKTNAGGVAILRTKENIKQLLRVLVSNSKNPLFVNYMKKIELMDLFSRKSEKGENVVTKTMKMVILDD
jgi:hypothetical protein